MPRGSRDSDPELLDFVVRALVAAAVTAVARFAFGAPWWLALVIGVVLAFGGWLIVIVTED